MTEFRGISNAKVASDAGHPSGSWHTRLAVHLTLVLTVATLLRAICFLVSCGDPAMRQMEEDSQGYLVLAQNLAAGKGFGRERPLGPQGQNLWIPELWRTPGYPVVVAGCQLATGHGPPATLLLQHTLNIGLCALALIVMRRSFGPRAGLLAGLLMALDLQNVAMGNLLLTESLYGVLLFLLALGIGRLYQRPSLPLAVGCGAVIGLSALVRPTSLLLPTLAAVVLLSAAAVRRRAALLVAGVVLATIGNLAIGAWIVRNGAVCGEYTFSTVGRFNLLNNHAIETVAEARGVPVTTAAQEVSAVLGIDNGRISCLPLTAEENRQLQTVSLQYIRQYWPAFVKHSLVKTGMMLFGPEKQILSVLGLPWVSFGVLSSRSAHVPYVSWVLLGWQMLLLGVVYVLVLRWAWQVLKGRRLPAWIWMALLLSVYVLGLSAGLEDTRFRSPVLPLLTCMAAAAGGAPASIVPGMGMRHAGWRRRRETADPL